MFATTTRNDHSYSKRLTALENRNMHEIRYPEQKITKRAVESLDFVKMLAEMEDEVCWAAGIDPAIRKARKAEHQKTLQNTL